MWASLPFGRQEEEIFFTFTHFDWTKWTNWRHGILWKMIKSFAHKGLELFFYSGDTRGIQAKHAGRISGLLDRLDAAKNASDMRFPGSGLHELKGNLAGHWSVKVSGNWRITFRFEDGNAYVVNYQDYH